MYDIENTKFWKCGWKFNGKFVTRGIQGLELNHIHEINEINLIKQLYFNKLVFFSIGCSNVCDIFYGIQRSKLAREVSCR